MRNLSASSKPTLCSQDFAEAAATIVLGAYRNTEVSSPKVYIKTTAAVMTCFTQEIVQEAFDPRTGLQTHQKWLPTVSEIREACEKVAGERANRARRALLNQHHVLIDTPQGLKPEAEAARLLTGPNAPRARTAEERARIADEALRRFRASAPPPEPVAVSKGLAAKIRAAAEPPIHLEAAE